MLKYACSLKRVLRRVLEHGYKDCRFVHGEQEAKLELSWIEKASQPKPEPCILNAGPDRSYWAKRRVTHKDSIENRLIFCYNLLALKALETDSREG